MKRLTYWSAFFFILASLDKNVSSYLISSIKNLLISYLLATISKVQCSLYQFNV